MSILKEKAMLSIFQIALDVKCFPLSHLQQNNMNCSDFYRFQRLMRKFVKRW